MIESINSLSTGSYSRLSTAYFPSTNDIKHLPQIVDIIGRHKERYTTLRGFGGASTPSTMCQFQSGVDAIPRDVRDVVGMMGGLRGVCIMADRGVVVEGEGGERRGLCPMA